MSEDRSEEAARGVVRSNDASFAVEVSIQDTCTVVALDGELDAHTAGILQRHVDEVLASGCSQLVLDMAGLRFIDSSGLRVVIGVHKRLDGIGGSLLVRSPGETVRRLFEITGLSAYLTIDNG